MLVVICSDNEDEQRALSKEIVQLSQSAQFSVTLFRLDTTPGLVDALATDKVSPDIIILDVDSATASRKNPGKDVRDAGFEGILIFVSQNDDLAIPGYDVEAFNYILKGGPDDSRRFQRVFLKAVSRVKRLHTKRIVLNGISEHRSVPLDSIVSFEERKHLCVAHLDDGTEFEFISTLVSVEAKLAAFGFVRTHRAWTVNAAHVASLTYVELVMDDGSRVPVGRSHTADVRAACEHAAQRRRRDVTEIDLRK